MKSANAFYDNFCQTIYLDLQNTTENWNELAEYGKWHNCCHSFVSPQLIIIKSPPYIISYSKLQPISFKSFLL